MRLTSAIWVAAFVRRCHVEGAYAVVRRRGSPEAGAIFVLVDHLDGRCVLFGQAPQALIDGDAGLDRVFVPLEKVYDADAARERLEREIKFDPDLWVVEVEDRDGRHFLDIA